MRIEYYPYKAFQRESDVFTTPIPLENPMLFMHSTDFISKKFSNVTLKLSLFYPENLAGTKAKVISTLDTLFAKDMQSPPASQ